MTSFDCIEKPMRQFYGKYGRLVSRHPFVFLLFPIVIAACLGSGVIYLEKETDVEYLFTPTNGRAKDEQRTVERLFNNVTTDGQLITRLTRFGRYGKTIIIAQDNTNVLCEVAFAEVLRLHNDIIGIDVKNEDGGVVTFTDICLTWNQQCIVNDVLEAFNYSESLHDHSVTFPYWGSPGDNIYFLGSGIGGEDLQPNTSVIIGAMALKLEYYLEDNDGTSAAWEDTFLAVLDGFQSDVIEVMRYTSQSLEEELNKASEDVFNTFTITFTLIINFSIWSCTKLDWVQNKPWLACLGVLSAGFAILSTFGMLGFCGVPFIDVVASTPILILSIGVDDMFIMICAWRRTNIRSTVEERMEETLTEAATSITITSITDALAFGIGAITYFPSVRIFCMFTGIAVLFDYFYQITFFAAAMALMGRREEANRHCTSCMRVRPIDESYGLAYKLFCAGGPSRNHSNQTAEDSSHAMMLFFRDYFAPFVTHRLTKTLTIFVYLGYIGVSLWGVTQLEEGLELRNIASDNSYVVPFYDYDNEFFKRYGPAIAVVFTDEHEYWQSAVQMKLDNVVQRFEESEFTYGDNTAWWLRDYLGYLALINTNEPSKEEFLTILREDFLQIDIYKQYSLDIVFNEQIDSIEASRFYTSTRDITNSSREVAIMNGMRDLADDTGTNVNLTVFHPFFIFTDQYEAVLPNTLQNLGIALCSMIVVSLLLIPDPICSVWVAFSIVSIEVGVIGLMSFWDVKLDSVSMINLILCIGFSVDFSAHIAYAFSIANGHTSNDRAKEALHALGMPIMQGACSTIIGIVVLSSSDVYIFRTFFKTLFLVITLGVFHSLFLLPILFTLFNRKPCTISESVPQVVSVNSLPLQADVLRVSPNSQRDVMEMNSINKRKNEFLLMQDTVDTAQDASTPEGKPNIAFEE